MRFEIETRVIAGYETGVGHDKAHSISWCELADMKKCMGKICPAWNNCCSKGRIIKFQSRGKECRKKE